MHRSIFPSSRHGRRGGGPARTRIDSRRRFTQTAPGALALLVLVAAAVLVGCAREDAPAAEWSLRTPDDLQRETWLLIGPRVTCPPGGIALPAREKLRALGYIQ
jgi:hypothetical protein